MSAPSHESPPPEQSQEYPGPTSEIDPRPRDEMRDYEGRRLLAGKRAETRASAARSPWRSPRNAPPARSRSLICAASVRPRTNHRTLCRPATTGA
jgi:hypothetical protein